MSTTDALRPQRVRPPLLDDRAPVLAPATRRAMARALAGYLALWAAGTALAATGRPRLVDLGTSLYFPGAAHVAHGHVLHGVVVLAGLAAAVLAWWMIGAYAAPIAVWLADVALAVAMGHGDPTVSGVVASAALVPGVLVVAFLAHVLRHGARRRRASSLNRDLAGAVLVTTAVPSRERLPVREADEEDLARLRLALDLALQPLDRFDGFDRRDQFREAALRYQLCILGYALATYRYTHTPAFAGYLAEAHARSIQKMGDRRVWGYWALENAWGRFSTGRDPVDNDDNIMLTGWQGVSVGMFETLEDDRFSRPGALTYVWDEEERYAYDLGSLAASVERNMRRSPFALYSCEPRWIYPVCNTFGVNTLVLHDRLHGGSAFASLEERIRRAYLEDFHRPDGRVVGVRSETLGLSWSPWAGDGVWLPTTYWMHPALPDLAHRSWWLLRETVLQERDGTFVLPPSLANRCDSGSYVFGRSAFGRILLAMAAREIGDEEVAANVLADLDATEDMERSGGVARFADVSTQGNLYALMARFGRHAGLRDLVGFGVPEAWRNGPRLADATYPDVLVARAVTDGHSLTCVLRPGAGPVRTCVVLDRLDPGRTYRVRGASVAELVSADDGTAVLEIDLGDRLELQVDPA